MIHISPHCAFDDSFNNETGFYALAGHLSASFQLAPNLLLRPGIGIARQWSDVSENDNVTATASFDATYVIGPQWAASARVSASQRNCGDSYEDVAFVKRADESTFVSASVISQLLRDITLTASVSYEKQSSSFYLPEFESVEPGLNFVFRHRF